jgi:hypothetical protein
MSTLMGWGYIVLIHDQVYTLTINLILEVTK